MTNMIEPQGRLASIESAAKQEGQGMNSNT